MAKSGEGGRYRQVLYIESDGTQILDTGINGGDEVEYEVEFEVLPNNIRFAQLFASSQNEPFAVKVFMQSTSTLAFAWYESSKETPQAIYNQNFLFVNFRLTFKYENGNVYVNDVFKRAIGKRGFGSNNFCIFGYHVETYKAKMRLYGCKIWKDGELVRELVPVEYNNAGYMYDRVSDTLFGDYNGGYFTAAPQQSNVMERVEYLETNGDQYIDTGFISTINTEFNVDYQLTGLTGEDRKIIGQGFKFGFGYYQSKWRVVDSQWFNTGYATDTNRHTIYTDTGKYYLDSTQIADRYSTKAAGTYAMLLLAVSSQNSIATDGNKAVMRLYSCKIYDNGVLVRDFYPVSLNGIGYLFDDVTDQLFENAGTGFFKIGNVIQ